MSKLLPMTPTLLRRWRIERGYSITKMRSLLRVSRMTYWRMETKKILNPYLLALALHAIDIILQKEPVAKK